MGYTLGPIINSYLALPNGGQIVMNAMGVPVPSSSLCQDMH